MKEPRCYIKKPSFLNGLASLFDLYNARQVKIDFSFYEDVKAMKSDFDLVGEDLWVAVKRFEDQNQHLTQVKDNKPIGLR